MLPHDDGDGGKHCEPCLQIVIREVGGFFSLGSGKYRYINVPLKDETLC